VARVLAAALALLLAGCATATTPAPGCTMAREDRAWLESALDTWRKAEVEQLGLAPQPLPTVIAADTLCTYTLPRGGFAGVTATPHGETVVFPDGGEAPVGPISFASGEGGYFAMSLPSVWRAAGVTSEFGLEQLMTGVLLHEMMHVRQIDLASTSLAGVATSVGVSDDELTDKIVQQRFESDPAYAAAYAEERDTLFAAAATPDEAEARRLAAKALELMRARHARWFTGDKAGFAAMDDVFLTMEGIGQWLIYRHFLEAGRPAAEVLPAVRRGGRQWSQDHGLALILVVDRRLPGWQRSAFRDPEWRASNLLAAAVAQRGE
jgi:hypothetical protein